MRDPMRGGKTIAAILLCLLLAACGGDGSDDGAAGGSSSSTNTSSSSASTSNDSSSESSSSSSDAGTSSSDASSADASSSESSEQSSSANSSTSSSSAAPVIPGDISLFNLEGFAKTENVTGGGVIDESSAAYIKVSTPAEFVTALSKIKTSTKPQPYKVIEIMNDLDLGWNEVGSAVQAIGPLRANATPKLHPTLIQTGVSLLDIQSFDGLTIFSKNGAKLRHVELNIKGGKNIIVRNLAFDEMWEWDEASKGDYDSNDWDFITLGDGSGGVSGVWIDHCTFGKSYDGIVDIKNGSHGVTISWSSVVPGNAAFIKAQFDALEASQPTMYKYLRGAFTEDQIIQIATPQKKGSLIGANNLKEPTTYTVTFNHDYFQDLQDRMPRLRSGDVHVYNLYADSSNARIVKQMRDAIVSANATLAKDLDGVGGTQKYHFGITLNGSISTEGGAIQVDKSVYIGVLTPLRNNQSDPSNAQYTGAIQAFDVIHSAFATDLAAVQSTYTDRGVTWGTWRGDSSAAGSTLGPVQAPQIPFAWHNGGPTYATTMHDPAQLKDVLTGTTGAAGAGRVTMTTAQWLSPSN